MALLALCTSQQGNADTGAAPVASEPLLTLLGTAGGPGARTDRSGIATLLEIGDKRYLIDAGEGVGRQVALKGLHETDIPIVFLTHLHDDHTSGLAALATYAFTLRGPHLEMRGPEGTADLVKGLVSVLNSSAEIRMNEGRFPQPPGTFLGAVEYGEGTIYQDDRVKVTAVENTHFNFPENSPAARNKSYSLKFETGGKVIVFTGDTGPSKAVEDLARGADVLVAEMVSAADRAAVPPSVLKHMDQEHLSPTEVGKMAQRAGVATLVLSHIGVVAEADIAEVHRNFSGRIIVGRDMMEVNP